MVTIGDIFVVHFNYEFILLYILIAKVLIYKIVGPGDHSDVARVRHILHVINFNDIGAQFSTSSEYNWCTKEKIDSDVRCTKFEHSILDGVENQEIIFYMALREQALKVAL